MSDKLAVAIWLVGYPMSIGVYRMGLNAAVPAFYARVSVRAMEFVGFCEWGIWIGVAVWLAP